MPISIKKIWITCAGRAWSVRNPRSSGSARDWGKNCTFHISCKTFSDTNISLSPLTNLTVLFIPLPSLFPGASWRNGTPRSSRYPGGSCKCANEHRNTLDDEIVLSSAARLKLNHLFGDHSLLKKIYIRPNPCVCTCVSVYSVHLFFLLINYIALQGVQGRAGPEGKKGPPGEKVRASLFLCHLGSWYIVRCILASFKHWSFRKHWNLLFKYFHPFGWLFCLIPRWRNILQFRELLKDSKLKEWNILADRVRTVCSI